MAHGRDKPKKEKRKAKKEKSPVAKSGRETTILQHVQDPAEPR